MLYLDMYHIVYRIVCYFFFDGKELQRKKIINKYYFVSDFAFKGSRSSDEPPFLFLQV